MAYTEYTIMIKGQPRYSLCFIADMVILQEEEIAYGAKELSNIQMTIRRLADNVPMEVISKDPAWTKVAEDLNDRYPILPIKEVIKELILHKAIVMLFFEFQVLSYDFKLTIQMIDARRNKLYIPIMTACEKYD